MAGLLFKRRRAMALPLPLQPTDNVQIKRSVFKEALIKLGFNCIAIVIVHNQDFPNTDALLLLL